MTRHLVVRFSRLAIAALFSLLTLWCSVPTLAAEEERPTNFIFLLDVSGSMLYKSEMVTAANGEKVFLFEALRQALSQIVQDERLVNSESKACVITFGTQITEKSDWPQKLSTPQDRKKLVQLIESPEALQADKHGDTYMGGALMAALDKANKFGADSDPCTTTFVVMLTDGWDEPPHGASVNVRSAAAKYVARVKEIQNKLGVKTWQAVVIGLQSLPDRKAGTTTARELAGLLDGQFLDVNAQTGGTVSEKIFHALKQTVENLKGEIRVAPEWASSLEHGGFLKFGSVDNNSTATASFPVELKSCYAEEITGIEENTQSLSKSALRQLLDKSLAPIVVADSARFKPTDMYPGGAAQLVSSLPAGAITLRLAQDSYTVAPQMNQKGERTVVKQPIGVLLTAHNTCPAGNFVGAFKIAATAKVPQEILFTVSVPERLVAEQENVKLILKKTGVFWTDPVDATMEDQIKAASGNKSRATYTITVTPESAKLASDKKSGSSPEATIDASQINDGKPITATVDTSNNQRQPFRLSVHIPARQVPGKYTGKLAVAIKGTNDIVGPNEIPYEIIVEPSPWEQVAPIAIPTLIILIIVCIAWFIVWIKTLKR